VGAWLSRVQGRPTQTVENTSRNDAFELELSPEERDWLIAELAELEPEYAQQLGIEVGASSHGAA
jgi:hypothetical protein